MSNNAIETLQFNCTTCPSECLLTVEVERDADGKHADEFDAVAETMDAQVPQE